jgi:hypothetical protein
MRTTAMTPIYEKRPLQVAGARNRPWILRRHEMGALALYLLKLSGAA